LSTWSQIYVATAIKFSVCPRDHKLMWLLPLNFFNLSTWSQIYVATAIKFSVCPRDHKLMWLL